MVSARKCKSAMTEGKFNGKIKIGGAFYGLVQDDDTV